MKAMRGVVGAQEDGTVRGQEGEDEGMYCSCDADGV